MAIAIALIPSKLLDVPIAGNRNRTSFARQWDLTLLSLCVAHHTKIDLSITSTQLWLAEAGMPKEVKRFGDFHQREIFTGASANALARR